MALNQIKNEHFNDAFEVYFPTQGPVCADSSPRRGFLVTNALRFRNRLFQGELLVNERIVEYPVVFKSIREPGRVLDIGCVSSRLPIQLASLGYDVHGLEYTAVTVHPSRISGSIRRTCSAGRLT